MKKLVYGAIVFASLGTTVLSREWTDETGRHHAQAEFVALDGELVRFRMPDGEIRGCKLAGLSAADQQYVKTMHRRSPVHSIRVASVQQPTSVQRRTSATVSQPACTDQGACQTVECTIMVPQMTTETRTVNAVEYRAEQRQRTYTEHKPVYETRSVQYEYLEPTYETRKEDVNYTVCKPVFTTEQRQFTVMVPHAETRQATRTVCRMVPVTQTRKVCEDQGGWQQVVHKHACGCDDCAYTCNVWVPKIVSRDVQYTVMKPQMEQVPYEYSITVCRPETRTQNVQVCNYVREPRTRTVKYQVCVLQKRVATREVPSCRMVAEEQTYTFTVQVPYTVQRQVQVQVCHMVPKKVTYQVPVCVDYCGGCGGRCW